jgi:phosphoglycolate phosphatase-like HAD superfamily hydrolase
MPITVLFDLDGTLTDPAPGIIGSFRKALVAGSSARRFAFPFRR